MSTLRQDVIKAFRNMSDDADVDEMMYQLYVIDRIRRGEQDIKDGNTYTQEEVEKMAKKW